MGGFNMHFDIAPPPHGGDLETWQRQFNEAVHWLDLSSACNREPWPIPALDPRLWYELPDQVRLYQAAQEFFGVSPIAVGAGTQQLIEVLPPLFESQGLGKTVMVPLVGYQEHGFCWQKWGYTLHHYESVSELLERDWDVAVVIHPNNPTGEQVSEALKQALQHRLSLSPSRRLIVDEAFMDASPESSWLRGTLPEQCVVLRSVGKFFGLAGARVGFAFGAESLRTPLRALCGPWPVATPALELVARALEDRAWQVEALASIEERNAYFAAHIVPKLNTLFDSQERSSTALFSTWRTTPEQAKKVFEALHGVGVHIRLGQGWVRVSLPAGHEMNRLNQALVKLLQGHQLKELG